MVDEAQAERRREERKSESRFIAEIIRLGRT
jgi:hypothetical protein